MKRFFWDYAVRSLRLITIAWVCIALHVFGSAWGYDSSGLSLSLYTDEAHSDLQFELGQEPILLIMEIRNDTGLPIVTDRGFSQVELYRSLIMTDPTAVRHIIQHEDEANKMPSPFVINNKPWALAETLPAGWVRSVTIVDFSELFPMMKNTPGWYTIEAREAVVRFASSGQDEGLGLLGLLGHADNWFGTVKSNTLQLFIAPSYGAQAQVQVLNETPDPAEPMAQVPVRVFDQNDIPADYKYADIWKNVDPVLAGTTNFEGWATWQSDTACIQRGDYTAVAYALNEYKGASFEQGEVGWEPECAGVLEKQIVFSQTVPGKEFSVFALNSIWLRKKASILSGHIGARSASSGPWLKSKVEVYIDKKAEARSGVRIYGDSVSIEKDATVFDVYYNELKNKGEILGEMVTPLELPVWGPPAFLESFPGKKDVKIKGKKGKKGRKGRKGKKDKKDDGVVELAAGAYAEVEIGHNGELHLLGGTYHFRSMKLDKNASLICLTPATILVAEGLEGHDEVYIGPETNSGISAAYIVLYIGGIEEKKGKKKKPKPKVKKVVIGKKSRVMANIYAPNSTLEIQKECEVEGSFIAKDVIIGEKVKVRLDTAFGNGQP